MVSILKKLWLCASVVVITMAVFLVATSAHAAVVLESGIPGVGAGGAQGATIPDLPTYINYLYIFVLGFVGIAGFISLVVWGTVWIASAVIDKKALALEKIKSTLTGIAIALTAFIMLYTINPDLTVIRVPTIGPITFPTTKTPVVKLGAIGAPCSGNSDCFSFNCKDAVIGSADGVTFEVIEIGVCAAPPPP